MPWEKLFDTDQALKAAMEVFWAKGYEETSMSDLINAMKINKGSLYNAYGDKKTLFLEALKKYDQEYSRQTLEEFKQIKDPKEAISSFFDCLVLKGEKDFDAKGCFLVNTSLKLSYHDDDIQNLVKDGLREVELFFEFCVEKIKKQNKKITNSRETAKTLMTLAVGLLVLSRGTFDLDGLKLIKKQAMKLVS